MIVSSRWCLYGRCSATSTSLTSSPAASTTSLPSSSLSYLSLLRNFSIIPFYFFIQNRYIIVPFFIIFSLGGILADSGLCLCSIYSALLVHEDLPGRRHWPGSLFSFACPLSMLPLFLC